MLLPVIVLAVAAFQLVQRDRATMELQVKAEADQLLEQILDKVDLALNPNGLGGELPPAEIIEMDAKRNLLVPPPFNPLPTPSPLNLSESERRLAEALLNGSPANSQTAINRFAALNPGERALNWFKYELAFVPGLEEERPELLQKAAQLSPEYVSEAGQPIYMLARVNLVKQNLFTKQWPDWCRFAVANPSSLTPVLLELATAKDPQSKLSVSRWNQDQVLRALWEAELKSTTNKGLYYSIGNLKILRPVKGGNLDWISDGQWLVRYETPARLLLWRADAVNQFANSLAEKAFASTEYFYPLLQFGKHLPIHTNNIRGQKRFTGTKGGGIYWKSERLDKMPHVIAENKVGDALHELKVKILLSSPELLEARLQEREVRLSILVGGCSLFALMGVVVNRRAIRKEHRLNELKSNFISSVSHELRAPVAAVRLMAENLENGTVSNPAQQEEYYKLIHRECRRLSRLIGNLLDFARIEQNRREYTFEEVSLEELALDTLEMVKPLAEEAQVQLIYEAGADVLVNGDRDALQQALTNLVDNAIKHSGEGQQVRVGITDIPSIWVEDRGSGIPPEEQDKIFERFYRRGNELRRKTEGVGIGLAIVKHIVNAHRGNIHVESQPGKGTRFTITLQESARLQPGGVHA